MVAVVAAACSGEGRTEAERAEIVIWLVEHEETPTKAECLADELVDYRVADFDALAAVEDDVGFDEVFRDDVRAAFEVCES